MHCSTPRAYICDSSMHQRRLFWLAVWSCTLSGAVSVILSNWERYQLNPTVISMNRNYMDFNTTFPAMTVCQQGVYNQTKADAFIDRQWGQHVSPENRAYYHSFVQTLSNMSYDNLVLFKKFENDRSIPQNGFYEILKEVDNGFPGVLEGILAPIRPLMTDRGLCFSINSAFTNFAHDRRKINLRANKQPQEALIETHKVQYDDGVAWTMVTNAANTLQFYVHSPYEFAEATERGLKAVPGKVYTTNYKVTELVAGPGLRALDVGQRRCRFPDESNLVIGGAYSYALCRTQCRMQLALRVCRCSPYFYPLADGFEECNISGLVCLAKYKDSLHFITDPATYKPDKFCKCMTPCDVLAYTVTQTTAVKWNENSQFQWQIAQFPRIQMQRSVLYGPVDLLVSFGGTVGFFLGCSLLSGVEVIYFYTLRLIWFIVRTRRIKQEKTKI